MKSRAEATTALTLSLANVPKFEGRTLVDALADFDCAFTVRDYHLYVHEPDHGWKATRAFALVEPPG